MEDRNKCEICHAVGNDKRTLMIRWLYDFKAIAPEFSMMYTGTNDSDMDFYGLRTCKACRGEILTAVQNVIDQRREYRKYELDSDGGIQYEPVMKGQ